MLSSPVEPDRHWQSRACCITVKARLSGRIMEPESASRPFDANRDGVVFGEGAGAVILESAEFAERRGANVLARIRGMSRGLTQSQVPIIFRPHWSDA